MKQIIVNVSGLTTEEKQRVNEALAKITKASKNKEVAGETAWFYAPSSYDVNQISSSHGKNPAPNKTPTHTHQQVLEMAGMEASTDQHVFLADKFIITDSSGRIVYDGTLRSISSFIKSRVSAGKGGSLPSSGFSVKTDENGVAVMVPKQGHPHAHLMALYAEDAKTTDKPWELWQFKDGDGNWIGLFGNPSWKPDTEYRSKPKTHIVNGVEVPDLRIVPKLGEEYWFPDASTEKLVYGTVYGYESTIDTHRVSNNLCYEPTEAGKQAAILHAKAWLGIAGEEQ